jgi:PAS domain S-box-containing protein
MNRIIYCNDMVETIFGWKPTDLIGRNIVHTLSVESEVEFGESIMTMLRNGQSWKGLYPCRQPNGDQVDVISTNYPMFGPQKKLIGTIGVACLANSQRSRPMSAYVFAQCRSNYFLVERERKNWNCQSRRPTRKVRSNTVSGSRLTASQQPTCRDSRRTSS